MLGFKPRGPRPAITRAMVKGNDVEVFEKTLVVKKRSDASADRVEAYVRRDAAFEFGETAVSRAPDEDGIMRFESRDPFDAAAPKNLVSRSDGLIEWAQPEVCMTPPTLPTGAEWPSDGSCQVGMNGAWGIDHSRFSTAWAIQRCDGPKQLVRIAVIDGGLDVGAGGVPSNPELQLGTRLERVENFVGDGTWNDVSGHGTPVLGIMAARANNAPASATARNMAGVNWGSEIHLYRVMGASGRASDADVLDAVRRAIKEARKDKKRLIINVSLQSRETHVTDEIAQLVRKHKYVLLVAPSGNFVPASPAPASSTPDHLLPATYISAVDDIDTVAALGSYSTKVKNIICVGGAQAPWTVMGTSRRGSAVDVVAPGFEVLTTITSHPWVSHVGNNGTSIAAPFVSGLASLIWQHQPRLWGSQVRIIIQKSASTEDLSISGATPAGGEVLAYGTGYIDAGRALHLTDARKRGQIPLGF